MSTLPIGNIVNDSGDGDTFRITATSIPGDLRLRANGDRTPLVEPHSQLLSLLFLVVRHVDDVPTPEIRHFFASCDFHQFRNATGNHREEVDAMVAAAGFPAECAASVAFFCVMATGLAASDGCSRVTVCVEMAAASTDGARSRNGNEEAKEAVTTLQYGAKAVGLIREDVCAICLEEFADGAKLGRLRCSHAYHDKCLRRWLHRKRACPSCRAPVLGLLH